MLADDEEKNTSTGRNNVNWWIKWIKASKKAAKTHWEDTKAAYDEYERMGRRSTDETLEDASQNRGYPIYWVSCKILEPNYYAKAPKIKSKRKFGIDDEMALTMSLITDRLGQFLIDNGNFDETMRSSVQDYIHGAKCNTQVIYSEEVEIKRMPLMLNAIEGDDSYLEMESKEPYSGEVLSDDDGYYYNKTMPVESSKKTIAKAVLYDEILHTPNAKDQTELTEVAFKFCMDKHEAEERFNRDANGKSKGLNLPYSKAKDKKSEEDYDSGEKGAKEGDTLIGWECYCLHTKKVYWVCEDYKDGFLAQDENPYSLSKFFPCTNFKLANKHRDSLYTTPLFVYVESSVNQLHTLYRRVYRLVDAIRRRALVYGLSPELLAKLNNIDGEDYISVGDMEEMLEKGGIENYVQYMPVRELVESLSECMKVEEHFKQNFYEWTRMPDILRGVSEATESLGAQEIKVDSANDSFRYDKKQIIDLCKETAELMFELGLKKFSDQRIAQICGYDYLPQGRPAVAPSQENPQGEPAILGHKERFFDALNRLRNDEIRIVQIDFETDSTSFRDDAKEQQKQQIISDVVIKGLQTISQIQNPQYAPIAMKLLLGVLNTYSGASSEMEDMIKTAVADVKKAQENPPPPPPDYEQMKLQIKQQEIKAKNDKDMMMVQIAAKEAQIKEFKAGLEQAQNGFEQQLLQQQQIVDQQDTDFKQMLAVFQAKLDQSLVAIEQQKIDLDKISVAAGIQESALEEARLAKQVGMEAMTKVNEFLQSVPKEPKAPIINVHVDAKQRAMKNDLIKDESGNILGSKQTLMDE